MVDLISHDEADALLRDPQTPDDVRNFARTLYGFQSYLDRVEFVTDTDGVTNVQRKPEGSVASPADTAPGQAPTPAPTAPESPSEEGQ